MLKNILCGFMLVAAIQAGFSSAAIARAIRGVLRDPASALFKWGEIVGENPLDSSRATAIYRGYVNSRNGYGLSYFAKIRWHPPAEGLCNCVRSLSHYKKCQQT